MNFNDTTYCNNPKCDGSCGRQWTSALQQEAIRWWGSDNAPVAFADFHERHEEIKHRNGLSGGIYASDSRVVDVVTGKRDVKEESA